MLFEFKKIVGALLMPMPMLTLLCLLALVLYKLGRKGVAKGILASTLVAVYLLCIEPVTVAIMTSLEQQYPKYESQPVEYIVVLGGGHHDDDRVPISSLLRSNSMIRLMEGVRIHQMNPGSKLMLSGYGGNKELTNAETMAKVAKVYGVDEANIILETSPRDTRSESEAWARHLNDDTPFALVTSASHMPRSMFLFGLQGLKPIPAPTDYVLSDKYVMSWDSFLPFAYRFETVRRAWHEYLGLVWAKLTAKPAVAKHEINE